jgi:hypothetical protein
MSYSSDYENFAPTATDAPGTGTAANAVSFNLNANEVNSIRWLVSSEKGMLAGTVGAEWFIRRAVESIPIATENIDFKQATPYGSANIQPVVIGKVVLYVQRSTRKVRELSFSYEEEGFRSPDRTLLADHISGSTGFKQTAHMKSPQSIAWFLRNDGVLSGLTYEKDEDNLIVGWHPHVVGGISDAAGTSAKIESAAVIPSSDGTRDDTWLIVNRRIGNRTVKYIEYISKFFDDAVEQRDAFFVDSGLTYDSPIAISGGTLASPCVITAIAHGLSNGDAVIIQDVKGLTTGAGTDASPYVSQVNGETFIARNVTANTFELESVTSVVVSSLLWNAYVSGGYVRKFVTTISGLWHLEGQSVGILGDGAVQPAKTVASGSVNLDTRAATANLGFLYNADAQMLRLEAGAADGTALGKTRRTHKVGFLLHRTLGFKVGTALSASNLKELTFRTTNDPLTRAPGLFSGIRAENVAANYDFDNQVAWRSSQPLPCTVLAVAPQLHTEDAA